MTTNAEMARESQAEVDALRLALAASQDEAEKAKAELARLSTKLNSQRRLLLSWKQAYKDGFFDGAHRVSSETDNLLSGNEA